MNRIVIVGNGYDLSHDLKTSYENFIVDYISDCINKAYQGDRSSFEDDLLSIKIRQNIDCFETPSHINFARIDELMNHSYISINFIHKKRSYSINNSDLKEYEVFIQFHSKFFSSLIVNKTWSNIEAEYFRELCSIYHADSTNNEGISELNNTLSSIKSKLISYLIKVTDGINSFKSNFTPILKCFDHDIQDRNCRNYLKRFFKYTDADLIDLDPSQNHKAKLQNILFINFNYTDTINKKFLHFDPMQTRIRDTSIKIFMKNIHGQLNKPKSIIFGYGDDSHEKYKELEQADNNELLLNMKSFYYPSEKNYLDIINFIESDDFDVFTVGHSLGLSDRVLLKTIFENNNCKAINLFHRGNVESHFEKRIALSRHFDDKIKMRSKIVEYDHSLAM